MLASTLAGLGAAVAAFVAVVFITTTVGTEAMQLPRGHHTRCDGALVVDYPVVPQPPSERCALLVRAL
jgi:hypothetical protein